MKKRPVIALSRPQEHNESRKEVLRRAEAAEERAAAAELRLVANDALQPKGYMAAESFSFATDTLVVRDPFLNNRQPYYWVESHSAGWPARGEMPADATADEMVESLYELIYIHVAGLRRRIRMPAKMFKQVADAFSKRVTTGKWPPPAPAFLENFFTTDRSADVVLLAGPAAEPQPLIVSQQTVRALVSAGVVTDPERCTNMVRNGWYCTRAYHADGPCATRPLLRG